MQFVLLGMAAVFPLLLLHKSKTAGVVLLAITLIVVSTIPDMLDIANYSYRYNLSLSSEDMAVGFNFISNVFHRFGIGFEAFHLFCVFLSSAIILICFSLLNQYGACAFALFVVYPFMFHVGQIRTGLATAFIIAALTVLFVARKHRGFLFALFVGIGASFHYAFLVFALVWLIKGKDVDRRKSLRLALLLTFILFVFVSTGWFDRFIQAISLVYARAVDWSILYEGVNLPTFCYQLVFHAFSLYLSSFSFRRLSQINDSKRGGNLDRFLLLERINNYSLILMPVYFINPTVFRLVRVIFLMNYPLYAEVIGCEFEKRNISILPLFITSFVCLLFFVDYCNGQSGNLVILTSWIY